MTLIEILISTGIGVLAITAICSFYFFSNRSFAAQYNYVDMDQFSHKALDQLSQQIRQVKALTSFSTNRLVFTDYDDATLSFTYDPSARTLVRAKGASRTTLLTGCDSLTFSIFQRNPVGGTYDQYPAADLATCKLIQVQWLCSRQLFGNVQLNTESMQSAKIVIRRP